MSIPSFSSFPPSFGSFPELEPGNNTSSNSSDVKDRASHRDLSRKDKSHGRERDKRKIKRDHGDKRRRDRDDGEKRHTDHDDERIKREEDRHIRLGADYDGSTHGLFIVDKTGDPMNIVYGGLHAGDVPKYKRVGYGNVMGLGKAFKIVDRGTGGRLLEIGLNGRRPPARYTDPHSFALINAAHTRQLLISSSVSKGKASIDTDVGTQAEYIRLPSRRGRSDNEPLSTYRSIHTSKENDMNSDSNASSDAQSDAGSSSSTSDEDGTIPRTAHQHSLAVLETALQKDPTSLPKWMALLEQTLSTIPPTAKSSLSRARAEIKLSVLDRAIRTHVHNKLSVELRVKWLNAGAEVWDEDKLEREWEQAVVELGGRRSGSEGDRCARNNMWGEWFRWRISSAGRATRRSAGVEGIVNDARRMMENIQGELAMVKLLWRTATVLRAAGFSERAMALFQAQAELTFNCVPNLLPKPLPTRLDALEEFWDAEHPRIGEPGAHGWNTWEQEGKPQPTFSHPSLLQQPSPGARISLAPDRYTRWAADEATWDAISSMPKHGDDAGEDPYTTVLFSDVRPLLVDITTPEAKHAFRLAWLRFLGLHIPGFAASLCDDSNAAGRDDVWSHTHLAQPSRLQQLFPPQGKGKEREWDSYAGTIVAREKTYGPTFGCVKEWSIGVFDPLEGINAGQGRLWENVDVSDIDKELARRVFEQLRQKVAVPSYDEEWDILAVAFAAAFNIKSALKLSRTLLSTSRNSLSLCGVHARLERIRGKIEEARRIYDTALSMASDSNSSRGEAALWWAWAEMEWLAGDDIRAEAIILRAAGLDPATGGAMVILRAKRNLEERMRSQDGNWKERESWACLRALLEVLSGSLEGGMGVLEGYVSDLGLQNVARESAWTRMLLLGWKQAVVLGRQVRRTMVRDKIAKVVREIEQTGAGMNSAVLGVFLEGEKGESVWGRVRALVGEGGLAISEERGSGLKSSEKGIARRVWEVWLANWDKGRWDSEKERVRNSLGIGVEEQRTRASAILWRIYVDFEIYCGELKRAKALLFRAVSECPLVKELYLIAFGPLRSVFTSRELEGWAETMAERGIRMHRGLDECVAGKEYEESENESESGGEEDLERASRDYRRLAPF